MGTAGSPDQLNGDEQVNGRVDRGRLARPTGGSRTSSSSLRTVERELSESDESLGNARTAARPAKSRSSSD